MEDNEEELEHLEVDLDLGKVTNAENDQIDPKPQSPLESWTEQVKGP